MHLTCFFSHHVKTCYTCLLCPQLTTGIGQMASEMTLAAVLVPVSVMSDPVAGCILHFLTLQ